jgi:hypothetical protein
MDCNQVCEGIFQVGFQVGKVLIAVLVVGGFLMVLPGWMKEAAKARAEARAAYDVARRKEIADLLAGAELKRAKRAASITPNIS